MRTYQDLMAVSEDRKGDFCAVAIDEFKMTKDYQLAKDGEAYYHKHNITIEKYQKFLTTVTGRKVPDIFSANYKLKTLYFRRLITQQVQYVLGNGLVLSEPNNKEKLGKDFDFQLQAAAKKAMAGGKAFGFWNIDHLEVFGYADTPTDAGFCPLYNEETAKLDAGIRYWYKRVDDAILMRCTLYEADGYTEYIQRDTGLKVEVLEPKRGYKRIVTTTKDGTIHNIEDENYGSLPIVPLYANDNHESELVGVRECIDCYDFIKSGLANDIDDTSGIYWVLQNTGGMDDVDLAQFIQRLKTLKGAIVDGDAGVQVDAHTVDVPVEARSRMLELLRKDLYEDFQALDVSQLSAAQKTTQEIQAAYQNQDNKCADFEYYLVDFVNQILEFAGVNDTPTFIWNRVVNQAEQTQMVLSAAEYLTDDVIIKHLPFLTPEEADEVINTRNTEDYTRFNDEANDEE